RTSFQRHYSKLNIEDFNDIIRIFEIGTASNKGYYLIGGDYFAAAAAAP
ncbi:15205_t:CDS:2, partial [Dentiscutata heterogama]